MKKILVTIFIAIVIMQTLKWVQTIMLPETGYVTTIISDQRRYCAVYFSQMICPAFYNKLVFYTLLLVKNYFIALSFNYLFLEKSIFLLELPLFLLGAYFLFRKARKKFKLFLLYFCLYPLFGPIFSLDWQINFWLIRPLSLGIEVYAIWQILACVVKLKGYES